MGVSKQYEPRVFDNNLFEPIDGTQRRQHMSFRQIEKVITKDGWKLVRVMGSHYQYKKQNYDHTAVIPNHGSKDVSIGVIKNLEKITGLPLRK